MTLTKKMTCQVIEWQSDNYGGKVSQIREEREFWGYLEFVSTQDLIAKAGSHLRDTVVYAPSARRQAMYKITVRDDFTLPPSCLIKTGDKTYKCLSAMYPEPKRKGYCFFYVAEKITATIAVETSNDYEEGVK